jgi:hypothetical protein
MVLRIRICVIRALWQSFSFHTIARSLNYFSNSTNRKEQSATIGMAVVYLLSLHRVQWIIITSFGKQVYELADRMRELPSPVRFFPSPCKCETFMWGSLVVHCGSDPTLRYTKFHLISSRGLLNCDAVYCCGRVPTFQGVHAAFIFRVKWRWRHHGPPETSVSYHVTKRRHNSEDLDLKLHSCERLHKSLISLLKLIHFSFSLTTLSCIGYVSLTGKVTKNEEMEVTQEESGALGTPNSFWNLKTRLPATRRFHTDSHREQSCLDSPWKWDCIYLC